MRWNQPILKTRFEPDSARFSSGDVPMPPLTARQREVLDFFFEFFPREQRMPSIREISEHFGMRSPNGVKAHLIALDKKGYIELSDKQQARSIRLIGVKVILKRITEAEK
jgi:repressor LexA